MIEKQIISLEPEAPQEIDFNKIDLKATIDLNRRVERPPLAISIGVDDVSYGGVYYPLRFGTFGNISMIKGEEKARKSFLKSLILGCALGGNSPYFTNDLEIKGYLGNKLIIDIDTEQDDYDSSIAAQRIPRLVGQMPPNYIAKKLREHEPRIRLQYLEWLFMESKYKNDLGVVSIDGYVDLIADFNSQTESSELTQKLMKWSTAAQCHITGVLHLNPNSDKARGHLGTILQQKCETVVIIKDEGDFSSVKCQRGRGKKFKEFCITINEQWLPEVINNPDGVNWK